MALPRRESLRQSAKGSPWREESARDTRFRTCRVLNTRDLPRHTAAIRSRSAPNGMPSRPAPVPPRTAKLCEGTRARGGDLTAPLHQLPRGRRSYPSSSHVLSTEVQMACYPSDLQGENPPRRRLTLNRPMHLAHRLLPISFGCPRSRDCASDGPSQLSLSISRS